MESPIEETPIEVREKAEPTLVKDLSETLLINGINSGGNFEPHPNADIRLKISELFGDKGAEVLLVEGVDNKNRVLVNLPYATGLSAIVVLDERRTLTWAALENVPTTKNVRIDNVLSVQDIIFASQIDGKSFNYKSVLAEGTPVVIDSSLKFQAFGGSMQQLPPIGYFKPPTNLIERGMWNVYKKIEPITLLHEARHSQQVRNWNQYTNPQRERDAWAYALNTYRKLKAEGLNLLPDIQSNSQIISRLELGLIRYDMRQRDIPHAENYSRRFQRPSPFGTTNCVDRLFRTVRALDQTASKDHSLARDTLFFRGQPRLARVPMRSLVRR